MLIVKFDMFLYNIYKQFIYLFVVYQYSVKNILYLYNEQFILDGATMHIVHCCTYAFRVLNLKKISFVYMVCRVVST